MSNIEYAEVKDCVFTISKLWWQVQGLQQTISGYGAKLTTIYKVLYKGRWRRIYAYCFSNVASLYIIVKDNKLFIHNYDLPETIEEQMICRENATH